MVIWATAAKIQKKSAYRHILELYLKFAIWNINAVLERIKRKNWGTWLAKELNIQVSITINKIVIVYFITLVKVWFNTNISLKIYFSLKLDSQSCCNDRVL